MPSIYRALAVETANALDSATSPYLLPVQFRPGCPGKLKHVLAGTCVAVAALAGALTPMMAAAETPVSIAMKLLVVSVDGNEPSFKAITSVLEQINVPYDVLLASKTPLTSETLSDGLGNGKYQGIMLATGNLPFFDGKQWASAFTAAQWDILRQYQSDFKVRQATLYTYPGGWPEPYCLANPVGISTDSTPVKTNLTEKGKEVFNYLHPTNPINFSNAWTYLSQSSPGTNTITPLLSTAAGNPIVSICTYPDKRENLTITADNNPDLLHSLALGYGIVNWVSKGFFIGSRQVYMNPQPDDLMLPNDLWDPVTKRDDTGKEYRITGFDFNKTIAWQRNMRARNPALFSKIMMEMPYNGAGVVNGAHPDKTLKNAIYNNEDEFKWISHTFTHALLTNISSSNTTNELQKNNTTANSTIGMSRYFKDSMIQPEISGLNNRLFLTAAYNFGIRNILCDISYKEECLKFTGNKPNTGYYVDKEKLPANATEKILVIPRYAANLYYNVSTPAEWESEYNHFYAPGGLFATFPKTQTMTDIVNREADNWLRYMMKYSIYSVMFHQSNLRAYDGTNSLLSKLMDATLNKYASVMTLPIESPSQHDQAAKIIDRMNFNEAGVTGTINLGAPNTIVFSAQKAAKIPVTGITAGTSVTYGGQVQSDIPIAAGETVRITAGPAW